MSSTTEDLAQRSIALYEEKWRSMLEQTHRNLFVAIEPESESWYSGKTMTEAILKAREAFPNRLNFVLRIGHLATVDIGVLHA